MRENTDSLQSSFVAKRAVIFIGFLSFSCLCISFTQSLWCVSYILLFFLLLLSSPTSGSYICHFRSVWHFSLYVDTSRPLSLPCTDKFHAYFHDKFFISRYWRILYGKQKLSICQLWSFFVKWMRIYLIFIDALFSLLRAGWESISLVYFAIFGVLTSEARREDLQTILQWSKCKVLNPYNKPSVKYQWIFRHYYGSKILNIAVCTFLCLQEELHSCARLYLPNYLTNVD